MVACHERAVKLRRDAQRRLYSLDPAPLAELDAWLGRYRRFWTSHLDALDTEVAARPKTEGEIMMSLGTLHADGDRRQLRFERTFDASIDEVWSALTEPE